MNFKSFLAISLTLIFLAAGILFGQEPDSKNSKETAADRLAERVVRSEEMVQKVTLQLRKIAKEMTSGKPAGQALIPQEWQPYLAKENRWHQASFGILKGDFEGDQFVTTTKFEELKERSCS